MCNTCTKSALYTGKLKLITKTTYCYIQIGLCTVHYCCVVYKGKQLFLNQFENQSRCDCKILIKYDTWKDFQVSVYCVNISSVV